MDKKANETITRFSRIAIRDMQKYFENGMDWINKLYSYGTRGNLTKDNPMRVFQETRLDIYTRMESNEISSLQALVELVQAHMELGLEGNMLLERQVAIMILNDDY